jgi:hypothetical protein
MSPKFNLNSKFMNPNLFIVDWQLLPTVTIKEQEKTLEPKN